MLRKSEAISRLNQLGSSRTPFSFYCDFLGENWSVEEDGSGNTPGSFKMAVSGVEESKKHQVEGRRYPDLLFKKSPVGFGEFKKAFDRVVSEINIGNSFLTNLTFQTPIETNLSLKEIFESSSAKYKLLVENEFVVFSPETFVKIKGNEIFSYPMKGTIDAALENARETIMEDPKELAEHVTIVDLIRNDLSRVAQRVKVNRFRYVDEIRTMQTNLLQVSSEIVGSLPSKWMENLGSILATLLPAGSISGAPKQETVRIIQEAESYNRGFYTGICGHFDGVALDTGVMIRFLRQEKGKLYYCSGGGITSFSTAEKEYQEMMDKVYLPIG